MLVRTQLFRILQEEGLERVSVLGLPFDRRSCEAVQRRPVTDPDQDGMVIEELQGGHQLRGHIIRRAKVVVGEYAEAQVPAVPAPVVKATPKPVAPAAARPAVDETAAMPAIKDVPAPVEPTVAMPAIKDVPAVEPTVAMPALSEPARKPAAAAPVILPPPLPPRRAAPAPASGDLPAAEVTVAMDVQEIESMVARKAATAAHSTAPPPPIGKPKVATPPPARQPAAPPPIEEAAEEPIVVEDWTDRTQGGTPAAVLGAAAAKSAALPTAAGPPPRPPIPPAVPPPSSPPAVPTDDDDDGSANATMVLADSALFMRPAATPVPIARRAPAPAAEWESVEQKRRENPRETQPVPREQRAAPAPAPAPAARGTVAPGTRPATRPPVAGPPARVRTGSIPAPSRPRTPVYEDVPTSPSAPAVSRQVPTNHPGMRPRPAPPPSRGGLYAGLAAAVFLLLIAAGVLFWKFRQPPEAAQVATASPTLSTPPTTIAIPEDVTYVTPGEASPIAGVPSAGPTTAIPTPTLPITDAPTVAPPIPTPAPVTPPQAVTPPPVTQPAAPVNPVPALLAQAEQAMTAKRYDDAISRLNEVLKVEPQNPEALAGKQKAMGERASIGRYFLTALTISEGKASGGGIKGFDGGQVVKSKCECALTYEIIPANPVQGQLYGVAIFLKNDSKKDIKPQSIAVSVTVNGSSSNRPVALAAKEVARGQKAMVGKLEDTWKVGTTSWSLEAAVGAGGNTYRAQLSWELRVPSGQ